MNLENAVGSTIRNIRLSKNLYAKTVAAQVPMSPAYLCEIEKGFNLPSLAMISDIAKGLDMSLPDLWLEIYKNLKGNE